MDKIKKYQGLVGISLLSGGVSSLLEKIVGGIEGLPQYIPPLAGVTIAGYLSFKALKLYYRQRI